jgi:ATP-dependent DNA helicase RecQ
MESIRKALKQYWGYDDFLPMQSESVRSVLEGRDSLLVLSTGGGKSICFQAPALTRPGMAVVVSPLISLMKDQVDALRNCGISAACLNSALSSRERQNAESQMLAGRLKLLYVAPERLMVGGFLDQLARLDLLYWAIDEAHCISHWGHDFRPEYRNLKSLKERFPRTPIHAFTATATPQVRADIVRQLGVPEAEIIVGSFNRPNLPYTVQMKSRAAAFGQITRVIDKHENAPGIIYCISRDQTDRLTAQLRRNGYRALSYHAGLDAETRRKNQEAFQNDEARIVVATVAFGMGIDKPNVRYVIHNGMPKSIECYQQESGRAGRDGLPSDCVIIYTPSDFTKWRIIIEGGARETYCPPEVLEVHLSKLSDMMNYCTTGECRRTILLRYFGEDHRPGPCEGCDNCGTSGVIAGTLEPDVVEALGEEESLIVGQKILSCVARLKEGYGAKHTVAVLTGENDDRVLEKEHNKLSTFGILREHPGRQLRTWIDELTAQGFLEKTLEYPVLKITARGWGLIRGILRPRLTRAKAEKKSGRRRELSATAGRAEGWTRPVAKSPLGGAESANMDEGLFESLRVLRLEEARKLGMAAYVVFTDRSLRDMAGKRPSTLDAFSRVNGVGRQKRKQWGDLFVARIRDYCARNGLAVDCFPEEEDMFE